MGTHRTNERLTPGQRQQLLKEHDLLERDIAGRVKWGMTAVLARKWGVSRNYVTEAVKQQRQASQAGER